jgi:hypothetical protein
VLITRNTASLWFRRVTWLGVAANLALAVPAAAAPARMLAWMGLPPATPLVWVRFAAVLLILVTAFYVPAAMDVYKYTVIAWLSVAARLTGVVFFAFQAPEYRLFGLFDLSFFLPQVILLALAVLPLPFVGAELRETSVTP